MVVQIPVKERVHTRLPLPLLRTITLPQAETEDKIKYPESDGTPMAETDVHRDLMSDALLHPLKERYRNDPDVYVSGNLFLYYEEGNPSAVVAPDVFVVFGVPKRQRRIYKLWEENKAPDIVLELTSDSTYREDLSDKRLIYESIGVREYFLFDPLRDYLTPPLQGFRLTSSYYVAIMPEQWTGGEWQIYSEVLNLMLRSNGSTLRLYDPLSEQYLLSGSEEAEAHRRAEERAQAAEAELARLRATLAQ